MAYILVIISSLFWGGNYVLGKYLVISAPSLTLTSLRWVIAVAVLLPVVLLREERWWPQRRAWPSLIVMGLTGALLFNLFLFMAIRRTSSDDAALISTLNPVVISIIAYFVLKNRLNWRQILAMALSFLGVLIVISKGQWLVLARLHINPGDGYMLLSVAAWGIYSVAARIAMRYVSPLLATMWMGIISLIVTLPINLATGLQLHHADARFWWSALYVGLLSTVLAMVFWNVGVKRVGATLSGIFLNFTVIFTAILAYLLFHESLTTAQSVGMVVVIGGVTLFSLLQTNTGLSKNRG
jgi:drug/metabolite transporter (DMT)-like permease